MIFRASTSTSVDTDIRSRIRTWSIHALRLGRRHLHRGDVLERLASAETCSEAPDAVQSSRPTSSACSSLLAVPSHREGLPMPWPAMTCSLKMRSNPTVAHCGLKMCPWMTPRLTGNGLNTGSRRSVSADTPSLMPLCRWPSLCVDVWLYCTVLRQLSRIRAGSCD